MKRALVIVLTMVIVVALISGCTASEGTPKTTSEPNADTSVEQEKAPVAAKTEDGEEADNSAGSDAVVSGDIYREMPESIKLGFITHQFGHTVPEAWSEGIARELEYFENVEYKDFDGEAKLETQLKLMEDLTNQEYDVILLQSNDAAALAPAVAVAQEKGIYVICLNLDANTKHAALVQMVDYTAGQIVADKMAEQLGGKGNVVILEAPPGATLGVNRKQGFVDRLAELYPDIEIVGSQNAEWAKDKAIEVMNSLLQANDKIDGVFGINDSMAQGAALAAQAAGRLDEMVFWGADGDSEALEAIEQGMQTGTIYTNCYEQGATAARLAMYFISSGINPADIPYTGKIELAPIPVTIDNVAEIRPEDRW